MGLNKKRRKRDWCPGGGEHLDFRWDDESRKECENPERRKVKYVRCKICGQRFEVYNRECEDPGCVHFYIPDHKAYVMTFEQYMKRKAKS